VATPRDVVVVVLDSLNRHMIGPYGAREVDTPTLDRLAARSVRFTNHHTGSLPCVPARHDLFVGALDFPWRPWGSIEVWEDAFTRLLRRDAGVSTMLVTDHPHLFEAGGDNYHHDWGRGRVHGDLLYDRCEAEAEGAVRPLEDARATREMTELLVEALRAVDAPDDQLVRLGLG
jgi:arylsulfatase A-like enzyme